MEFNKYQSSEEKLQINSLPQEVQEQFYECLQIPFIKWMTSVDRPRAKDLPRDDKGRIIVDITKPHILEDMDYFRPTAIHFQRTGRLTDLKPNGNPNSAYGQWILEEVRRCREGYVRESDGEWITGYMYYFLNYCPISQTKMVAGSKQGKRVIDFPETWDGIYLRFHYLDQAQYGGKFDWRGGRNGCEISSRGKGKSYTMASILSKNFHLGVDDEISKQVKSLALAYSSEYLNKDGILTKFQSYLDFVSEFTQFPHLLLKNSPQEMNWLMGWKDNTGGRHGTLNEVLGVAVKDDVGKIRGKRQNFIVLEEFGNFKNVREIYNLLLPSITEGDISFGTLYAIGTSGDDEANFQQAIELVYNPEGYRMYALPNVWDKPGEGRKQITFFYPEYMNRKGYYDENGNSDVTGAIVELLMDRYRIRYNTTDINSITRVIAERPITPQEAIMRAKGNKFPVTDLNIRLNQLDSNSSEWDDVYVGELYQDATGEVLFRPTNDKPIRQYPIDDNMTPGALEIYQHPEKDSSGKVFSNRYIGGIDPIDTDGTTASNSLYSVYVLDLFTDNIVASYTGRKEYADDCHEIARLLALYYNAKLLFENNLKSIFAYFSKMHCLHLLADTPEYLVAKQIVKVVGYGNQSKGVRATVPINNYADDLIKEWLIKPEVTIQEDENGNPVEITRRHLFSLRDRALIQEMIQYNPYINVDRIRALGMLMLYREQFMVTYGGDVKGHQKDERDLTLDPFFIKNFACIYSKR